MVIIHFLEIRIDGYMGSEAIETGEWIDTTVKHGRGRRKVETTNMVEWVPNRTRRVSLDSAMSVEIPRTISLGPAEPSSEFTDVVG